MGNNPIGGFDPSGKATIFVHGTWSRPGRFSAGMKNEVLNILSDFEGPEFSWEPGDNNRGARSSAANALFQDILSLYAAGEDINLVGHSHGGNVILEASQLLDAYNQVNGTNITIKNVILIGTPIRDDYDPAMDVMKTFNILSNTIDDVQRNGGYDGNSDLVTRLAMWISKKMDGEQGDALRAHPEANNILLSSSEMKKYGVPFFDYVYAHSAALDKPQMWKDIKGKLDIKK